MWTLKADLVGFWGSSVRSDPPPQLRVWLLFVTASLEQCSVCAFVFEVLEANREAREMFKIYIDKKEEILCGCA